MFKPRRKTSPAWGEGVITDARRRPIEAGGAMPADRDGQGSPVLTVGGRWNLEIQGF